MNILGPLPLRNLMGKHNSSSLVDRVPLRAPSTTIMESPVQPKTTITTRTKRLSSSSRPNTKSRAEWWAARASRLHLSSNSLPKVIEITGAINSRKTTSNRDSSNNPPITRRQREVHLILRTDCTSTWQTCWSTSITARPRTSTGITTHK